MFSTQNISVTLQGLVVLEKLSIIWKNGRILFFVCEVDKFEIIRGKKMESMVEDKEMKLECMKRLMMLRVDKKIVEDFVNENKIYATNITKDMVIDVSKHKQVNLLIDAFEKERDVKIYHVVNIEKMNKVLVYLLYVKRNNRCWRTERMDLQNGFVEAYVYEEIRETRDIGIEVKNGKIIRIV